MVSGAEICPVADKYQHSCHNQAMQFQVKLNSSRLLEMKAEIFTTAAAANHFCMQTVTGMGITI
ncbi:hypothetical protein T11_7486 [Trichinella zimbabwensis]|uniref:Uncharacterized protein n=1 Tax=Trichinella zimbabwensis TaxID=268475 RepID=A0A0V1GTW5_9BILA|nr:hypothetical protein T11_7486 [Trichinella zimbabwensis]